MDNLWTMIGGSETIAAVGERVVNSLRQDEPFCLWLDGDLGAGKTTLVGCILHTLGLSADVPVTSPTFNYLQEYQIAHRRYAHLDMYRCAEAGARRLSSEDLGLVDAPDLVGVFVEWPLGLVVGDPIFHPTHHLAIRFVDDGERRLYEFSAHGPSLKSNGPGSD